MRGLDQTMIIDTSYCKHKIIDVHGQTGVAWLDTLPSLLAGFAARWSLEILPPFPVPSYNYVVPVVGPGGEPLVLKAGVPHDELWSEIDALRVFDGRGIARLLDADRERGVLLLERVLPGDPLRRIEEVDQQVGAFVDVLQRLWRPLPKSTRSGQSPTLPAVSSVCAGGLTAATAPSRRVVSSGPQRCSARWRATRPRPCSSTAT